MRIHLGYEVITGQEAGAPDDRAFYLRKIMYFNNAKLGATFRMIIVSTFGKVSIEGKRTFGRGRPALNIELEFRY